VGQGIEENDPTAITNNADPANAIAPFSGCRLNLWNTGYFHSNDVLGGSGTTYRAVGCVPRFCIIGLQLA